MSVNRRQFLQIGSAALATSSMPACSGPDKTPTEGIPRSKFDEESTAEQVTEGLDLGGKIAVVTGCNSGIGLETMRVLALRGAHVIGTARTIEKAEAACDSVGGATTPVILELSDFESVLACSKLIRALHSRIDMLICNAGMRGGERETAHGLEKHFVVNHLGHFILVNNLVDRLYPAWQGRVVVVGSRAAYRSAPDDGIEFSNLRAARDYSVSGAYAHSKLANALFSLELARLLQGSRITSNCLHPGLIKTNIARNESALIQTAFGWLTKVKGKTIEQGAATTCYVATSPLLVETSGAWFEDCNAVTVDGDHHLYDTDMASELWNVSEWLTADYLIDRNGPNLEIDPAKAIGG